MKLRKCTRCGKERGVAAQYLPEDTVCMTCRVGKPMPDTVYDISINDHAFKMTFDGAVCTWEIFQRIYSRREPVTSGLLEALVWPDMTVLEIGACFGYFTLQLADLVGPDGRIVSIEPRDDYFQLLCRNLSLNNITMVEPENIFVHTAVNWKSKFRGRNTPALSLTECLRKYCRSEPGLVFLDIEGYEHNGLIDLCESGWFCENRPPIVWEIHNPIDEGDCDNDVIIAALKEQGYDVHRARGMNVAVKK